MHSVVAASQVLSGTALLVDRDDVTRRSYADHLRQSAWATEEAADGREALAKALARRPDVIVTETHLPGISGYDLCEILKRDVATRGIPVVMLTADALQRATTSGADGVLSKPCLPAVLQAEIQRVLAISRDLSSRAAAAREKVHAQVASSTKRLDRARESARPAPLSHAYNRHDTTAPPVAPPDLICPECDHPLLYLRSHIGGVSARYAEQWDYFDCSAGCGTFQYRERTRKLRKVL